MRSVTLIALLASLVAICYGYYVIPNHEVKYGDEAFLLKQKQVLLLFHHVYQTDFHDDLWNIAEAWSIKDNYDKYKDNAGQAFWTVFSRREFLPMDEIFSINMDPHEEQVLLLFNLFTHATGWDVFYKTAVWARFHVNTDMFIYSFTAAFLHYQELTAGLILPAVYEINPYYFYSSDVIQKAQDYKMRDFYGLKKIDDVYTTYIYSNYTKWADHFTHESKIAYFTEDIGWNAYYYYFHMDYPFWLGGETWNLYKDRRGGWYMYQYQQILARYYLERVSNGLGAVGTVDFYGEQDEGYYPFLRYFNGMMFPYRDEFIHFHSHDLEELVLEYESRLKATVDVGYFVPEDSKDRVFLFEDPVKGVEYFGNFMQANVDSKNTKFFGFWENIAKGLMSGAFYLDGEYNVIPGVLDHFETAMREPLFYEFYTRFVYLYDMFKYHLDSYTKAQLNFEGVKIERVVIEKLITYFEFFDADITNVVHVNYHDGKESTTNKHWADEDFVIYGRTQRLNHVPFDVKIYVNSPTKQKAIVKFFIAPKYDEHHHEIRFIDQFDHWFELEHFVYDLEQGENVITRRSTDFTWFVKDRTTTYELYKKVMLGLEGTFKFPIDNSESHCGFPERLMLPRGTREGFDLEWFFVVYPFKAPAVEQFTGFDPTISCGVGTGARQIDSLPFGFPFDRHIDLDEFWVDNMFLYESKVFFKTQKEINAVVV